MANGVNPTTMLIQAEGSVCDSCGLPSMGGVAIKTPVARLVLCRRCAAMLQAHIQAMNRVSAKEIARGEIR